MRGRLDGFAETRFMGPDGEWLIGGAVPLPRNWIGVKRMAHLAAGALSDLRQQVPGALDGAPILICLAEEDRPGRPIPDPAALAAPSGRDPADRAPPGCRSSPMAARRALWRWTAPAA